MVNMTQDGTTKTTVTVEAINEIPERWRRRLRVDAAGCWIWTGRQNTTGYGATTIGPLSTVVHRGVYEVLIGPIPSGLQLDHLCRVRLCCNPNHLEPVTARENVLRGETIIAKAAAATACPAGHEYAGENLYLEPKGGRRCYECQRERDRKRRAARTPEQQERQRRYDREYLARRRLS